MLDTYLDYEIFHDFCLNQPERIPIGSEEDNKTWHSMWEFLRSGTNLSIHNVEEKASDFLKALTTNRKGTKVSLSDFKKPHKNEFPKKQNPRSVFFLDSQDKEEQNKYRKKNGYIFGFKEDYLKEWINFSLHTKKNPVSVRKDSGHFKSWHQLEEYITPFTDMVIVDNFMFDYTVWEQNLFEIIKVFANKAPVKFNLLLVSYIGNDKALLDIELIFNQINQDLLNNNGIACNLSIALFDRKLKEHDRGIFTNYLRIKSGDSFVFLNSKNEIITKGTELDFQSMSVRDNFIASDIVLQETKKKIEKLKQKQEKLDKPRFLIGDLKNKLLEHE